MSKTLIGLCTQVDRAKLSQDHLVEKLGNDIDVYYWAGLLYQIANDDKIQKHIIDTYKKVYIYGHRNCAYYDYKGHDGPHNEVKQNLDIHYLEEVFIEHNFLEGKIDFIEEKNNNIIIDNCEYPITIKNNLVDCVLVYPVEYWQNSQRFINSYFKTEKFDQFGYFSSGPASIDAFIGKIEKEIIDISIDKHKAKRVVFLVKNDIEQDSCIVKGFNEIVQKFTKKSIASSVFAVGPKIKEHIMT